MNKSEIKDLTIKTTSLWKTLITVVAKDNKVTKDVLVLVRERILMGIEMEPEQRKVELYRASIEMLESNIQNFNEYGELLDTIPGVEQIRNAHQNEPELPAPEETPPKKPEDVEAEEPTATMVSSEKNEEENLENITEDGDASNSVPSDKNGENFQNSLSSADPGPKQQGTPGSQRRSSRIRNRDSESSGSISTPTRNKQRKRKSTIEPEFQSSPKNFLKIPL